MINQDDDFDKDDETDEQSKLSRRKILIFLIPALIAIGLGVGFYYAFSRKLDSTSGANYNIIRNVIEEDGKSTESVTVFYDLPEINARLKETSGQPQSLDLKLSLELSDVNDIPKLEALTPRIQDAVISHTVELTPAEVESATGIYWLKEELLYRINLLAAPVKVNNLNFKNFEIRKPNDK